MSISKKSYRELKQALDEVLQALESDSLDIDEAIVLHKKGQEIVVQMEKYLTEVGASIKKTTKNK